MWTAREIHTQTFINIPHILKDGVDIQFGLICYNLYCGLREFLDYMKRKSVILELKYGSHFVL